MRDQRSYISNYLMSIEPYTAHARFKIYDYRVECDCQLIYLSRSPKLVRTGVYYIGDEGGIAVVAVGQLTEFQPELESITAYLERAASSTYFLANEISGKRRAAVLLSMIGSRTHSLLRSVLHPEVPGEKMYMTSW